MSISTIIGHPEFLSGGRAFFTVSNDKGEHFTYRINKPKPRQQFTTYTPFFASVLKGPDNYSNYKYIGIYDPGYGIVRPTKKSSYPVGSKEYDILAWAIRAVHGCKVMPEGYAIQHAGKCCVCARKLTTPQSIEAGIGPVCLEKQ